MNQSYTECRVHELRKLRILMVDGHVISSASSVDAGTSARVFDQGYWGFAASPSVDPAAANQLLSQATRNARVMHQFGQKASLPLPVQTYIGEHIFAGKPALSARLITDSLSELNAFCKARYPELSSVRLIFTQEMHSKQMQNSIGSRVLNHIQRAAIMLTFIGTDKDNKPVEVSDFVSGKGSASDIHWSSADLTGALDTLYEHFQAKRDAVSAKGGTHQVIIAPAIAGILAHEAIGHPCEADLVLGGAITANLVGEKVASELITLTDFAHTYNGSEAMMPVYADDEGTPARDAVLIERGILREFMHSRESASKFDQIPTGSARAYLPSDEPLIRMRNTAILPGSSRYDDMIAGMDDGYLMLSTSNGQADSTTEFMFGINIGYEVKHGKIGRAIKSTTMSGSALKVLQSVDAVSDQMAWNCGGYCGKKQPMVVSMGGPAIRAYAQLGGQ
jgi:TldD protein